METFTQVLKVCQAEIAELSHLQEPSTLGCAAATAALIQVVI